LIKRRTSSSVMRAFLRGTSHASLAEAHAGAAAVFRNELDSAKYARQGGLGGRETYVTRFLPTRLSLARTLALSFV
jgi:hypothetical protein